MKNKPKSKMLTTFKIFLVAFFFNLTITTAIIRRAQGVTKIINFRSLLKDISCYKFRESDENYTPPIKSIFFIESSCKGGLNSRQICSVESAARMNPDRLVRVIFPGPISKEFIDEKFFSHLGNVELIRINVTNYVKGTPFEELISGDRIVKSRHPVMHISDILRILTLYKYGGIYLDLDIMVLKKFDSFPNNFVVKEDEKTLASAILSFSTGKVGRHFMELAVRDLAATYNPGGWMENGPWLIMRIARKICGVQDVEKMTNRTCNGVHIMDPKQFLPIYGTNVSQYFEDEKPKPYDDAYTHHLWNSASYNIEVRNDTLYARLAKIYCPEVYEYYGDRFGV